MGLNYIPKWLHVRTKLRKKVLFAIAYIITWEFCSILCINEGAS